MVKSVCTLYSSITNRNVHLCLHLLPLKTNSLMYPKGIQNSLLIRGYVMEPEPTLVFSQDSPLEPDIQMRYDYEIENRDIRTMNEKKITVQHARTV
uniref:SFRICE_003109 n=1 Tax=Spodoptera frugiperda TaxID=7108 RepID=A0A2H1VES9_SPOFR